MHAFISRSPSCSRMPTKLQPSCPPFSWQKSGRRGRAHSPSKRTFWKLHIPQLIFLVWPCDMPWKSEKDVINNYTGIIGINEDSSGLWDKSHGSRYTYIPLARTQSCGHTICWWGYTHCPYSVQLCAQLKPGKEQNEYPISISCHIWHPANVPVRICKLSQSVDWTPAGQSSPLVQPVVEQEEGMRTGLSFCKAPLWGPEEGAWAAQANWLTCQPQ